MHQYEYVDKKIWKPIKRELIEIICKAQDDLRDEFTFQFKFVGSAARNMITCDYSLNAGFDFDVNLCINDPDENFSAKDIKEKLMSSFNKVLNPSNLMFHSNYDYCENSTRVFTIKVKDTNNSRILHSADFCIINEYTDDNDKKCEEYIRYNKKQASYTWEQQSKGFIDLDKRLTLINTHNLWDALYDHYLYKKNHNYGNHKKSRSLFAEAVKEVCDTIK